MLFEDHDDRRFKAEDILTPEDLETALRYVGKWAAGAPTRFVVPDPDVIIGEPHYLYRWHLVPRNNQGNVYFHIQVGDDPDRPLHDHPWDNQSVILAGGYHEVVEGLGWEENATQTHDRPPGTTIQRPAAQAHRLLLRPGAAYSMSLFTTGPNIRAWGFHTKEGWVAHEDAIAVVDGHSTYIGPKE